MLAVLSLSAGPAGACGFLVAANGAVRLERTTTLASWQNGVEHYITSFRFASDQASFGSIIPVPGEPTVVERAGDWTLQRLEREVQPAVPVTAVAAALGGQSAVAKVLREVRVDSLDVTVLQGGGESVARWANEHGFNIDPSVTQTLERYGRQSPYFVAAKFDAARAKATAFQSGDGIPIHLEIPLDRPWVPLEILAAGKPGTEQVKADVFLLTPEKPRLAALDSGVKVAASRSAGDALLNDLRNDKNSAWVPRQAWLTHVSVDSPAAKLRHDLLPVASPGPLPTVPSTISPAPSAPPGVRAAETTSSARIWAWALGAAGAGAIVGGAAVAALPAARRRIRGSEQSVAA
jgi:hypothetical protein